MIPYVDLRAQYLSVRDELRSAVGDALDAQQLILGEPVQGFEEAFAAYCGVKDAVAVNSGTSALHLALLAAGVEPGDGAVLRGETHTHRHRSAVVRDGPGADRRRDFAAHEGDPAGAFVRPGGRHESDSRDRPPARARGDRRCRAGTRAEYKGRTKSLGACGEGGMVTTNNAAIARKVRMLRDWGQDGKYNHVLPGFNYRMEGFQSAVLGVKLRHLDDWTEQRRRIARCYDRALDGADVVRPVMMPNARHVYHTYTIRSVRRDALRDHLQANSIQPAYADLVSCVAPLAETERAAREVLSLPMFAEMTDDMVHTVAAAVRSLP